MPRNGTKMHILMSIFEKKSGGMYKALIRPKARLSLSLRLIKAKAVRARL